MGTRLLQLTGCIVFLCCSGSIANTQTTGRFAGELVLKALPDGRTMELVQPFGYTDSHGLIVACSGAHPS